MLSGKYAFISYNSYDKADADWIKLSLEANGIPCWMAPDSIPGGSSYATEIENAIKNCSVFVLVLSERAQSSKWVSKEVDRAINFGKTVMPYTLDSAPLEDDFSFYLSNVQRYDATTDKLEAMRTMLADIREEFHTPQAKVVFKKKPPKSKNSNKNLEFLKPALIILVVIAVLWCGIDSLLGSIASDNAKETSLYKADSKIAENNFQSWFDAKEEETTNPYEEILNNLTFELDGVKYSLPCNVSELYKNGWVCETSEKDEAYCYFDVEMKKGDSSIRIKTYSPFENEATKLIDQKVGKIEYTPDCNVTFSVAGIKVGASKDGIVATFGEPVFECHYSTQTELRYYLENNLYYPYVYFECYPDTNRCFQITLENYVYEKKY